MSFVRLAGAGIMYPRPMWSGSTIQVAGSSINAANEKVHFVGQVMITGGDDAGSKTLSAAGGGHIMWRSNSVIAFSDAGTNFRIGLQDADVTSSPVHGDDTFDVYADLVGGTDTVSSNTTYETVMETGSKTLSNGDLIVVAFEFTSRGGSDWVGVSSMYNAWNADTVQVLPGVWHDDGTPSTANGLPICAIEFDDGTLGWINGGVTTTVGITESYNVNTSGADEYGNLITPEFDIVVSGVIMSCLVSGDAEVCLYSDPLGSPTLLEAITIDATGMISSGSELSLMFSSEHTLRAGESYGITYRPTTTTNNSLYGLGVTDGKYWPAMGMDADKYHGIERLNNSGAFSISGFSVGDKDRRFFMTLRVCAIRTRKGIATAAIGL